MKTETQSDTLGDVEVEALVNTLANTLAEAKVNTLRYTRQCPLRDLVDTSADTLA